MLLMQICVAVIINQIIFFSQHGNELVPCAEDLWPSN